MGVGDYRRAGFMVVLAAVLVSGPRLAAVFLLVDGLVLPRSIQFFLFGVTGLASAIALTVGNAYLAHVLAKHHANRGMIWWVLAWCWIAFLVGAIVLTAPHLVAGLRQSELVEVLHSPVRQWIWSITAVLVVEMLAAAAMMSIVLGGMPEQSSGESSAFSIIADAAVQRIASSINPAPAQQETPAVAVPEQEHSISNLKCPNHLNGCDYEGSEHGLRAHKRWCEFSSPETHKNGKAPVL